MNRTRLLASTALVAVSLMAGAAAHATDVSNAASTAPTALGAGTITTSDDTGHGAINANGGVAMTAVTINHNTTLYLYDSDNTADAETVTFGTADVIIDSAKTLTVVVNAAASNAATTETAGTTLAISTNLNGADTATRGGSFTFQGDAGQADIGIGTLTVAGSTKLNVVTVAGGAGSAAAAGSSVNATFGDASSDSFDVTGLAVTGGVGGDDDAGGASTVAINGTASIGASNLSVTGGNGDDDNATNGGAASLTFNHATTITGGTVTVTGGTDAAGGGDGGAASLTFTGNVTSDSTLAVSTGGPTGGAGNAGNASVTFGGDATFTAMTLNVDDGGAASINVTGAGAQTIAGTINGVGGAEGALIITDSDADTAANQDIFTGIIGGSQAIASINVGSSTLAGSAQFQGNVSATNITLTGGDHANETALAEFQGAITATTITLDDNTGVAKLTVNATNGTQTVAGAITAGTGGEGTLAVIDDDAGAAPDAITFSGTIGGNQIGAITVGNSTQGGSAIFSANATVTAGTVTVTGGDHASEDSQVEFQHSLTATTLTLDDSTGDATAIFNMTNGAQTISAAITGGGSGEGTLKVYDDDAGESDLATFSAAVGGTKLKAINIGTSTMGADAQFDLTASATTITITAGDAAGGGENAGAVFVGDASMTTLTLTGGTGNAGNDATAVFRAGLSATTITLDDGTDGQAELTINTLNGAQSVGATINGGASGEGKLIVIDGDAGAAAQAVTFTGNVGATNKLLAVEIGTQGGAADAAAAVFNGTVSATTITLTAGNAANETALATFDSTVTATNFNVVGGGDATADATATVKGNLTATTTTLTDATGQAQLALSGTSAQTIAGAITGGGAGQGFVNVTNTAGTVTFSGALGGTRLLEVEVGTGATAVFNSTVDATTIDINGSATFNVASNGSANATLDLANGAKITLGSDIVSGNTVFTVADVVTAASSTVYLPSNFTSGTIKLADSTADASGDVANITAVDTALVDYTVQANGNDVDITASKRSTAAIAANLGTTASAASALDAGVTAAGSDSTVLNAYTTALNTGGSEAKKAAEQSQPNITGSASQAITSAARGASGAVSARLASARTGVQVAGLQETGVAAGDGSRRNGGWGKVFGNISNQDDRDGIAGYDSHTYGVAVGMDNKVTDTVRLGGALSYAQSNIDGNDSGESETDIDSYQVAVYGSYEPGKYYIEGQLAYAFNKVDTSRQITFGGLNRTASGSYDANQYSATLGAGVPMKQNAWTITPKAGLFYSYTDPDSYTESGAGVMNLEVNPDSTSILEGSLGVNVAYDHKVNGGMLRPEARAAVLYEFLGDEGAATSKFSGAGASFETKGLEPAQFGGTLGFGLGYTTADGVWEVRGDYDAELREDFVGHSGMLTGRINF